MDAEIGAFRVRFLRCPPPEISLVSRSKLSPVAIAVTVDGFGAKIKNRKRKMKKTRPSDGTSENGLKKKRFLVFRLSHLCVCACFFFRSERKSFTRFRCSFVNGSPEKVNGFVDVRTAITAIKASTKLLALLR